MKKLQVKTTLQKFGSCYTASRKKLKDYTCLWSDLKIHIISKNSVIKLKKITLQNIFKAFALFFNVRAVHCVWRKLSLSFFPRELKIYTKTLA